MYIINIMIFGVITVIIGIVFYKSNWGDKSKENDFYDLSEFDKKLENWEKERKRNAPFNPQRSIFQDFRTNFPSDKQKERYRNPYSFTSIHTRLRDREREERENQQNRRRRR